MTEIVTTPAVVADLQASFDALANQLHGLLQEVSGAAAADAVSTELLSGKISEALDAIESARAGIEANGGHLTALSSAVAADFDDVRAILTDLLAAVSAIPGGTDTTALEQLIAANSETIGVVLDVVNGISEAQDAAVSELTALASAVAGVVGQIDSIAGAVSGIATDIASIKARLDDLEAGNPGGGDPEPEPILLPLAGFNAAGLGNNPQFAPGKENTHFRTFARRDYQSDYVTAWVGHLQPELGDRFLIRIPYALERLFVISGGVPVLQESYAALIEEVMNQAGEHGGLALLDAHNYCRWWQDTPKEADGSLKYPALQRYSGTVVGVSVDKQWFPIGHAGCAVSYAILAEMYVKIAQRFGSNPHLFGYGLMNEPHGRGALDDGVTVEANWISNVQSLVDAVRAVDSKNWITVGGCGYSSAKYWRKVSDGLRNIVGEKIIYEAHQYPDENGGGGGQWKKGMVHSIDPAARVNDWTDFLDWCAEVGRPALAGEYGAPITAEKWTANSGGTFEYSYTVQGAAEYLEQLNAMFDSRRVPRTQWLAGPGDADNYANGMDNSDGTLKPNANALFDRLGNTVEAYGPTAF